MLVRGVLPRLVAHPSLKPLRYAGMKKRPATDAEGNPTIASVSGFTNHNYEGPQLHELYEPVFHVFKETTDTLYLLKAAKRGELELLGHATFNTREEATKKLMAQVAKTNPPPASEQDEVE